MCVLSLSIYFSSGCIEVECCTYSKVQNNTNNNRCPNGRSEGKAVCWWQPSTTCALDLGLGALVPVLRTYSYVRVQTYCRVCRCTSYCRPSGRNAERLVWSAEVVHPLLLYFSTVFGGWDRPRNHRICVRTRELTSAKWAVQQSYWNKMTNDTSEGNLGWMKFVKITVTGSLQLTK